MKIVLVDNLLFERIDFEIRVDQHPHLGLISLGAITRAARLEPEIYDPKREIASGLLLAGRELYGAIAERLLRSKPNVVGFTTLGCTFLISLRVAQILKRTAPNLPIILGGPHATILHREI